MSRVRFEIVKKPRARDGEPVLFSIIRNEAYFLPHFLRHYRSVGVTEFWFLDDHSTDASADFLCGQEDCGLLRANLRFGDAIGGKRFGPQARSLVPQQLFAGRWVLSVDADEFLILPSEHSELPGLIQYLDRAGIDAARALMLDFFPQSIERGLDASPLSSPFSICPYFDAYSEVDWPDEASEPRVLSVREGVRPRLYLELLRRIPDLRSQLEGYRIATAWKTPLAKWVDGTALITAHRLNRPTDARVLLALAHFKFTPGARTKIDEAIESGAYWKGSIEYRMLHLALQQLADRDLRAPETSRRFRGPASLEECGLLFVELE